MSTQIDYARIVLLNRTARELLAANPVLLSGEVGVGDVGTVSPDFRIGDGIRPWSALPSFRASGIGGGIFAPFEVQNTINGHPLFQVNDLPGLAPGQSIITMGPGEAGNEGTDILHINGNVNGYGLVVTGATHTQPNVWLAAFAAPVTPARSNGVWVAAGTNSGDACFSLGNAASTYDPPGQNFMLVRGDGSGQLGPAPNQLIWDAQGNFNLTGHATLPGRTMEDLTDVTISGLRLGDVLQWNGTAWGNVSQLEGYVTRIETGTGLRGGPITATGTIALEDTMVAPGWYHNATIVVDQQGRITYATNGEMSTLADVEVTDPQEGQALTWNGTRWVNSMPAKALEDLTDVDIVDKIQGEVLSWNEQTGKWTNSVLPGGSVIALETLQDVDITDPEPGQVLTWDGSNWINEKGGGGASVTIDTTPPADPESGWLWWDAVSGQLFIWYDDGTSAQWVIANSEGGMGGGGEGGGGGGLAQDQWGTYVISQSDLAKENWSTALHVIGGDYAWALEVFESGAAGSPNFGNGLCIYTTNSGPQPALRVWDGTINGLAFQIGNNGSGDIRPNGGVNRMYWDATGFYLAPGPGMPTASNKLATISDVTGGVGLSVPIAFAFPKVSTATAINIAVTMPMSIPANLAGSRGVSSAPSAATTQYTLQKYIGNAGVGVVLGYVTFNTGSQIAVVSGPGGTVAPGDGLQLSVVADASLDAIGITIHATRA